MLRRTGRAIAASAAEEACVRVMLTLVAVGLGLMGAAATAEPGVITIVFSNSSGSLSELCVSTKRS